MNAKGIIRRVDDLGRIVLPKEWRYRFNIQAGSAMELIIKDDCLCLKPFNEAMFITSRLEDIFTDMVKQCTGIASFDSIQELQTMKDKFLKKFEELSKES